MTQAMVALVQCLVVNSSNKLWIIPFLPERTKHHIGNAQLRAKDSPVDQAGHMSVCPLFVCKFGIVDPYHPILILLQLGTDGVCLSGVYTPMTVPYWYTSKFNE